MPDRDPDVRIAIQHSIKLLGVWTAILYGFVAVILVCAVIWAAAQRAELQQVQDRAIGALCTFRSDLERRYESGVQFLREHPDGVPGIPASVIQTSVNNQRDTLESLQGLPCSEVR